MEEVDQNSLHPLRQICLDLGSDPSHPCGVGRHFTKEIAS